MKRLTKIDLLVAFVTTATVVAAVLSWYVRMPYPGTWQLVCFMAVLFILDQTSNPLRIVATGSTSFILHLAGGILFGGYWGGLIAGASTAFTQVYRRQPVIKTVFNVAQRTLSVLCAAGLYYLLGGHSPPTYLYGTSGVTAEMLQADLGLFFVYASTYIAINALTVTGAVAFSTERSFKEVWHLNSRGVLGYDLGASTIAILVAWLFLKSEEGSAYGPFGLLGVVLLIVVVRHVYGMYRRLQSSGIELLDLMVKAIEARDPYTSGHSIRVATLAKAMAQEVGMSSAEVEQVYTAALLHDVGKIHEEFAPLLRKETKLTPEETALLQTHASKSADLVGIISSFRGNVQDAVRSHHERWDGGGYPDGLAGERIPLGARIIMISDTTDAMTTDRPYRKRLALDAVISELQKYEGSQFDPKLVDMTINSVVIRRVIAELQSPTELPPSRIPQVGGSKRVTRWRDSGLWKAKSAF